MFMYVYSFVKFVRIQKQQQKNNIGTKTVSFKNLSYTFRGAQ